MLIEEPQIGQVVLFKLVKRGLCPCGFPVVNDDVPLGKIYGIEKWTIIPYAFMICGGCKQKVPNVNVGIVIENGKRAGKMVTDILSEISDG